MIDAGVNTHRYIDTGGLTCLNERGSGTVAKVFKPWDQRLDRTAVLPPFRSHVAAPCDPLLRQGPLNQVNGSARVLGS